MPRKALCAALLSVFVFISCAHLRAQANVTENQSVYLYVDQRTGQDSNSGSQSAPLQTIQAAIRKAAGGGGSGSGGGGGGGLTPLTSGLTPLGGGSGSSGSGSGSGGSGSGSSSSNSSSGAGGVKIIVNPGVYRETVTIANHSGGTLTLQAASPGTAIVAGSNVLTGWSYVSSSVYSHPWTYYLNTCSQPPGWPSGIAPIVLRDEMFFVNAVPQTQVMNKANLRPGTFYIDDWGGTVYLSPPTWADMSTAVVEAAVRSQDLIITASSNVVVRGLVFRHAANCILGTSASIYGSSNILIDSSTAQWNNWGGFGVNTSTNITVQNSLASYNGGIGIQGAQDQYVLLSGNESSYNNWRGAQAALYDWGMGGTKFLRTHNATVQNHLSYRNQAQGLWFDTDNKNIEINNVTLAENVLAALQMERTEGPVTLENSALCSSGGGINLLTSQNFTIRNNTFYNNGGTNRWQAELFAGGPQGGYPIVDWVTGQYYDVYDSNLTVTGNVFEDASSGQLVFGTYLSGYDWSHFANTLNAGDNTWYDPFTSNAFKITLNKYVNLSGWQNAVGTDFSSSWSPPAFDPSAACGVPTPSYGDFTINVDNQQYQMTSSGAVVTIRVASFVGSWVSLAATGIPSGVTGKFSTTGLTSGVVKFTLTASASASYLSVPITLWATSGSRVHSVTFYVNVVPGTGSTGGTGGTGGLGTTTL